MAHPTPIRPEQGVDEELIRSVRGRVVAAAGAKAAGLFAPGAGPDALGRPGLKPLERVVQYYDYQACCISVLARAAAAGSAAADDLVANILAAVRAYLDEVRPALPAAPPPRRLLLHLARAYGLLEGRLTAAERARWRRLATRVAEDVIEHNRGFHPGLRELHNATLGTGTNHVAVCAEGVFFAGRAFRRPEWCDLAGEFVDRLVEFCHSDGYFEENINVVREGGPSLSYTNLTYGAAFHVCRARQAPAAHEDVFRRCAAFSRAFLDADFQNLTFADERTNRRELRTFGAAAHSLSAEGRGYLRAGLAGGLPAPIEKLSPEMLARLDHELDAIRTGPGATPEPWRDGDVRLSLPLAVRRRGGWTAGLSALVALNRELRPDGDYALDRQDLLALTHRGAGAMLCGSKSKGDPDWSTLRVGDDAWPVRTGEVRTGDDELAATVHYRTFAADVAWRLGPEALLVFRGTHAGTVLAQLALELGGGQRVRINGGRAVVLGGEAFELRGVRAISSESWSARADREGTLRWPVAPHDPYNESNRACPADRRVLWVLPWTGQCRVRFAAHV